jgi:hypothetical protein
VLLIKGITYDLSKRGAPKITLLRKLIFLSLLVFLLVSTPALDSLVSFSPRLSRAIALESSESNPFLDFVGEVLVYRLDFYPLKHIADAEFYFGETEDSGRYYAELRVETKGLVGWVTQRRRHIYRSEFEVVDQGRRLRSLYHKQGIFTWEKADIFEAWMDYKKMKQRWKVSKNGAVVEEDSREIPEGEIFEDILSAFYNFRGGVFGKVELGKRYRITSIPTKGVTHFNAWVATNRERKYLRSNEDKDFESDYMITVEIPPEIFDSKTGDGRIWFNRDMIPVAGLIEDIKGLGDIVGNLYDVSIRLEDTAGADGGG